MILTVLLAILIGQSQPQTQTPVPPPTTITFRFENPQLQPTAYSLEIHEDGSAHYNSAAPDSPQVNLSADAAADVTPPPLDREAKIGDPLRSALFAAARSHHYFAIACEAPKSHVAFSGKKILSYSGTDGRGACTYNYSKDDRLNRLAEQLEAVSFTLEEGQKLAMQHEHSRLSLDAEMETLADAAKAGRALEIQNIAPQLQAIADDEEVLDRARKRARELLAGNGS